MTYIAPRPTTYCGVDMRSRLEARMAAHLDEADKTSDWTYEPRAFADKRGQYLPDFLIRWSGDNAANLYLEVKPTAELALAFLESHRMEVIWSSDPDAHLLVAYPVNERRWSWLICDPESREWQAIV